MSLKPSSVSVVMPSYNEKGNITEAIHRIEEALGEALLEVIIVDDNSPDGTWQIVEDLHNPKVRLMRRIDKRGLASALADGTNAANGDFIVWLDCDLGIPPEDIVTLLNNIDGYDAVVGSRYMPGGLDTRSKLRAFMSRIFNLYTRIVLGYPFGDWTSGFAVARKDLMRRIPLSDQGFGEYFVDWVYRCLKANVRIIEIPYRYGLRKTGMSKTDGNIWVFMKLGFNYAMRVLAIRISGGSTPQ